MYIIMIVIQTVNICKINFIIIVFQTYTRKSEVHTKFFKSNKSKILIKIQKKKNDYFNTNLKPIKLNK